MISKDLVAASAKPLILSILADGESYGYAIIQKVSELSEGRVDWKDGMLYPVLHRLERQGFIESYWKRAPSGRKRKYYRLKPKGATALEKEKKQWMLIHSTLRKLWGGEPCFP